MNATICALHVVRAGIQWKVAAGKVAKAIRLQCICSYLERKAKASMALTTAY